MAAAETAEPRLPWIALIFLVGLTILLAVDWTAGAPRVNMLVLLAGGGAITAFLLFRWRMR